MLRHRWAPALFESRTDVGPAAMRYYDGVLGHLRQGDFPFDLAHHALHVLGSRALGFTQELFEPEDGQADEVDMAALEQMADQLPNITRDAEGDRRRRSGIGARAGLHDARILR